MSLLDRFAKAAMDIIDPFVSIGKTPPQNALKYLRAHMFSLRTVMLISLVTTVLTASLEIYLISYTGWLLDALTNTPPEELWETYSTQLLWACLFVLLIRPGVSFYHNLINFFSYQCNSTTLFRWNAYQHVSKQPIGWFQKDMSGRIANRLFNVGNYASDIIFRAVNTVAFGAVYIVGIVIFIAGNATTFAIPILIWLGLYICLVIYTIPRAIKTNHDFSASKSAVMGSLVDNLSNFETIALYSSSDALSKDYRYKLDSIRGALFHSKKIQLIFSTSIVLLEGVMFIGFVGYGVWLWIDGQVSVGLVGVSLALSLRISSLADQVFHAIWTIFERVGSLKESLTTVSEPLRIVDDENAKKLSTEGGSIQLNNVSHTYGLGKGSGGIQNLSLKIGAGEKIGIVGRSGAGKSTLINLIVRSHEAEEGSIQIDEQDIRKVTQESLREAIGVVSQQANLLNRSVLHNITLGNENISQEKVQAAAREAKAHDFIMKLKDDKGRTAYDAHIGERGITLSGGQRQRLAIARALLKNAKVLILDEATSALDSEVEAEIQEALENAMKDKTVIAIAHRLSTITQMDRIIVLDEGSIIEQGTHSELLEQKSLYSELWSRQTGGFDILED